MKDPTVVEEPGLLLERAALRLAISETRDEEEGLKKDYQASGIACGATEVGGTVALLHHKGKLASTILATAINTGLIEREARKIHALVHATQEASSSMFIHTNSNASFALKIGLTTDFRWIAVAIFGRVSLHPLSEHCRVGLGYMHL